MERDNIKLIAYTINKYNLRYIEDDIIDIAYIGYTKAINSYNKSKGELSTWIVINVRQHIYGYLRSLYSQKRLLNKDIKSLNDLYGEDGDIELIDIIPSNEDLEKKILDKVLVEQITEYVKNNYKENYVKVFNYAFKENKNNYEIAKIMGVSHQRIQQMKQKLIKEIRKEFTNE